MASKPSSSNPSHMTNFHPLLRVAKVKVHPRVLRHFKRRIGAKPTLVSPLEDATALCVSYSLNKLKKGTVKRLRRSHFQVGRKGKRVGNGRQSPLQKQRRKKKQRIPGVSERLAAANVLLKRVKMTPGLLSSEEETEGPTSDPEMKPQGKAAASVYQRPQQRHRRQQVEDNSSSTDADEQTEILLHQNGAQVELQDDEEVCQDSDMELSAGTQSVEAREPPLKTKKERKKKGSLAVNPLGKGKVAKSRDGKKKKQVKSTPKKRGKKEVKEPGKKRVINKLAQKLSGTKRVKLQKEPVKKRVKAQKSANSPPDKKGKVIAETGTRTKRLTSADSGYPLSGEGSVRSSTSVSPLSLESGGVVGGMIPNLLVSNGILDDSSDGSGLILRCQDPSLHSRVFLGGRRSPDAKLTTLGGQSVANMTTASSEILMEHEEEVHKDGIIFPDLEQLLNQSLLETEDEIKETLPECTVDSLLGSEDWFSRFEAGVLPSCPTTTNTSGSTVATDINVHVLCDSLMSGVEDDGVMNNPFHTTGFEDDQSPAVNVANIVTVKSNDNTRVAGSAEEMAVCKKKRGRPRKRPREEEEEGAQKVEGKCKRGRPRKRPRGEAQAETGTNDETTQRTEGSCADDKNKPKGSGMNFTSKSGRVIKPSWKLVEKQAAQLNGSFMSRAMSSSRRRSKESHVTGRKSCERAQSCDNDSNRAQSHDSMDSHNDSSGTVQSYDQDGTGSKSCEDDALDVLWHAPLAISTISPLKLTDSTMELLTSPKTGRKLFASPSVSSKTSKVKNLETNTGGMECETSEVTNPETSTSGMENETTASEIEKLETSAENPRISVDGLKNSEPGTTGTDTVISEEENLGDGVEAPETFLASFETRTAKPAESNINGIIANTEFKGSNTRGQSADEIKGELPVTKVPKKKRVRLRRKKKEELLVDADSSLKDSLLSSPNNTLLQGFKMLNLEIQRVPPTNAPSVSQQQLLTFTNSSEQQPFSSLPTSPPSQAYPPTSPPSQASPPTSPSLQSPPTSLSTHSYPLMSLQNLTRLPLHPPNATKPSEHPFLATKLPPGPGGPGSPQARSKVSSDSHGASSSFVAEDGQSEEGTEFDVFTLLSPVKMVTNKRHESFKGTPTKMFSTTPTAVSQASAVEAKKTTKILQTLEEATTPTKVPEEVTTPTKVPEEVTTPTKVPEEATTPTKVPEEVTTPTKVPEEVTTPTKVPEEVTTPTKVPEEVTTPTKVPLEVTTPTKVPEEVTIPTKIPQAPVLGDNKEVALPLTNEFGLDIKDKGEVSISLEKTLGKKKKKYRCVRKKNSMVTIEPTVEATTPTKISLETAGKKKKERVYRCIRKKNSMVTIEPTVEATTPTKISLETAGKKKKERVYRCVRKKNSVVTTEPTVEATTPTEISLFLEDTTGKEGVYRCVSSVIDTLSSPTQSADRDEAMSICNSDDKDANMEETEEVERVEEEQEEKEGEEEQPEEEQLEDDSAGDFIDLHADDDDEFLLDMHPEEDPLARIFPSMDKKQNHKKVEKGANDTSQASPLGDDGYGFSSIPPSLKSRLGTPQFNGANSDAHQETPPLLPPPPPPGATLPPLFNTGSCIPSNAHHHNYHPFQQRNNSFGRPLAEVGLMSRSAQMRAAATVSRLPNGRAEPLPDNNPLETPPPLGSNPFLSIASPSSPCSTTSSQDSSSFWGGGGGGGGTKYCRAFLRGWCNYGSRCRYTHVGRDCVPIGVLEEIVLSQLCHLVPVDVTQRYTSEHHSSLLLQSNFSCFVSMIQELLKQNLNGVISNFEYLCSLGVRFNASFLCRLLNLFSGQPQQRVVLATVKESMCQLSYVGYMEVLRTMAEQEMFPELKEAYLARNKNVSLNTSLLTFLLRSARGLGEWVFRLLEDVKLCDTKDGEDGMFLNTFLSMVDYQLLLKEANALKIMRYLDSCPSASGRLSVDSFKKLCGALSSNRLWLQLVSLFHLCLRLIPNLGVLICEPLEVTFKHVSMSEKVMGIFERLTEEQKAGLSNEVWNKVMMSCAQKGRSQRATKFYNLVNKLSKQLSNEVLISLMELMKKQHNPSVAIIVLRDGLQRSPPLIPPLPLLSSLAASLDTLSTSQDLQLIVTSLIRSRVTPPLGILQSLLAFFSREKCYSRLAEVVKMAREYEVMLDKTFCQSVLEELRQWGQDQYALSVVASAFQQMEEEGEEKGCVVSTVERVRGRNGNCASLGGQSAGVGRQIRVKRKIFSSKPSHVLPPPPPPPDLPTAMPTTTTTTTPTKDVKTMECNSRAQEAARGSQLSPPSLEEVVNQGPYHNTHELLQLIESSGKQGLFRAVASILVEGSVVYDELLLCSIWEAITSSVKVQKANAFDHFLSHLDQCRSLMAGNRQQQAPPQSSPTRHLGASLLPCDHWLVSQIGVALLKLCEANRDWQSGFVVLHHLHRFGIQYVRLSQPPSTSLPPLVTPCPPSPCSVALTAVNLCLHMDRGTVALQVLKDCDWVAASSQAEQSWRTELIATLAQRCLERGQLNDTWNCLEAIVNSGSFSGSEGVERKFIHPVNNLHNTLLQEILNVKDIGFALVVFRSMKNMKSMRLQCLPSVFSSLLQALCDTNQSPLAQKLCETAIADSCYAPMIKKDVFEVTLPVGLVQLELHLLLREHLKKLSDELGKGSTRDLVIHLSSGSRDVLKQVLSADLSPRLSAKFESQVATIPNQSLREWVQSRERQQQDEQMRATCGEDSTLEQEASSIEEIEMDDGDCLKEESPVKGRTNPGKETGDDKGANPEKETGDDRGTDPVKETGDEGANPMKETEGANPEQEADDRGTGPVKETGDEGTSPVKEAGDDKGANPEKEAGGDGGTDPVKETGDEGINPVKEPGDDKEANPMKDVRDEEASLAKETDDIGENPVKETREDDKGANPMKEKRDEGANSMENMEEVGTEGADPVKELGADATGDDVEKNLMKEVREDLKEEKALVTGDASCVGNHEEEEEVEDTMVFLKEACSDDSPREAEGLKVTSSSKKCMLTSQKRSQKEAVCREFVENMKLHYKSKFRTKGDYSHLLKKMCTYYFATSETFAAACRENTALSDLGEWTVPDSVKQEITSVVLETFSKFSVYSKDLELGLTRT